MQRSVSIFLGIFLSALIVYGGSGVNAYFYCCGDCRVEGPSAVMEHKCCEIHHHHHDGRIVTPGTGHECSRFVSESHSECGVDRIKFDWQSSQGNQIQLQPAVIDLNNTLFSCTARDTAIVELLSPASWGNRQTQKPPDLSKQDYFSLLTTLII
ncbi:hypothetical protein [Proteiniphilum acetatigenes]|uniref:hypothetical protein n=1 Tax=Proteiniphilum acetatigenes TaxID=294710 RepID=UPI00035F2C41|nr:hypothetical protein [Proteiniphilum acetatigenes]SFL31658.1 hypothetical protein SAMN05216357_11859 [Porphyromonadaceae bacterium KH3CP3RA]